MDVRIYGARANQAGLMTYGQSGNESESEAPKVTGDKSAPACLTVFWRIIIIFSRYDEISGQHWQQDSLLHRLDGTIAPPGYYSS